MPYKDPVKAAQNARERSMRFYWKNRDNLVEKMRIYRDSDREHFNLLAKKSRDKRKDYTKEYNKNYRMNNKERIDLLNLYNNHKNRSKIGIFSVEIFQKLYEENIKKFGTLTCILCMKNIEFGNDSLEHLIPICRGGTNEYSNLGISHIHCNRSKHTKTVDEFKIYLEKNNELTK